MIKKLILALSVALALAACGSDSSTGSEGSTRKDYHVTFRYAVSLDGKTGNVSSFSIVANLDMEFMDGNRVRYCPYLDGRGSCETLAYNYSEEDGDKIYEMSRKGGNVFVEFVPKASDTEGPILVTMDYDNRLFTIWTRSDADLDMAREMLLSLTEQD